MTNIGQTPIDVFHYWEENTPHNIFLSQPVNGSQKTWTYQQAGDEIRRIAAALQSYNFLPHSNIAILSKNCAHWIMADLAIWMAGFVSVPLYPTLSAGTIQQLLEHSHSRLLFAGKLDTFAQQKSGIPPGTKCISFSMYGEWEGESWEDVLKNNQPLMHHVDRKPEELATIKYTSGTTGNPKGVMISFKALHVVTTQALKVFNLPEKGQRFFSYLPLSHIAERMLVEVGGLYAGAEIHFSESLEKFPNDLMKTQPTVFLAVPRIWAKFKEKIEEKIPKLDRLLKIPLISTIVKRIIKKKLGLSKAIWILTGAAPISIALLQWFDKLGIKIHEVYGMTENLAYSHINLHEVKFGTVGKKWPDVAVKFSDEGEIMIKHDGLMLGYYRDHQQTADVFTKDGFLKTGDKGEVDAEGFLTITGRIRDQFKTDKAKFIDPAPIELKLLSNPDMDQVCVVGTGIPQPIALIVLSVSGKNKSRDEIEKSIANTMSEINKSLETYERLKSAVVLQGPWTIENGLMTPTLKVKRNEVEKLYLSKYPGWYKQETNVVWQ